MPAAPRSLGRSVVGAGHLAPVNAATNVGARCAVVLCVCPRVTFALFDEQPMHPTTHLSDYLLGACCRVIDQDLEHDDTVSGWGDASDARKWSSVALNRAMAE